MNSSKEIGGYFQLEPSAGKNVPHQDEILVNSARCALELLLRNLPNLKKVLIPYFTCDVVLEPFAKLNIPYAFYHIDEKLELRDELKLDSNEYLLYTNYFGVKDTYIKELDKKYGSSLIVDCAQALFFNIPIQGSIIYSPRKFVGLPDGGMLKTPLSIDLKGYSQDSSYDRCSHLLKRIDLGASAAYPDFKENDEALVGQAIKLMSPLTRQLMDGIDFDHVKTQRKRNFEALHQALKASNLLNIDSFLEFDTPMVYPYLTDNTNLRQELINNKIFVATYWPNVLQWCNHSDIDYNLTKNIIPLPIDQRYDNRDMAYIQKLLKN